MAKTHKTNSKQTAGGSSKSKTKFKKKSKPENSFKKVRVDKVKKNNNAQNFLQGLKKMTKVAGTDVNRKVKVFLPHKENKELNSQIPKRKVGPVELERVPISKELVQKFSRGEGFKGTGVKTNLEKAKLLKKEKVVLWATEQTARTSILQTEEAGTIEAEENEVTRQYSQSQISKNVDITSAAKCFELKLEFGPYRINYTKNGRYLLLGGRKGHVACMDWITKKLMCETNVMEQIYDVQWLHQETMFAVAQKDWVYMYDNLGVELHCIKALNKVIRLEFLPYHFLLASGNEHGFLGWLDTSIGTKVSYFNTKQGRLRVMTQNPYNAVICLGHTNGTVTMWSPTVRDPLVKMLCHKQGLTSLAVDHQGRYMVSASVDRSVKVWDVRQLSGPVQDYRQHTVTSNLAISHRGYVATSSGNIVEVYNNFLTGGKGAKRSYLKQQLYKPVENMQFCPYEDVLGVGTQNGFSSLLIPGCGEPNFDAYEANPFQSKSQRKEAEVKALLEKIQPEMITLDPTVITEVDVPTLKDKLEAKKSLMFVKPPNIDFTPKNKMKRHGRTVQMAKTKKIMKEQQKKEFIKAMKETQVQVEDESSDKPKSVLDRFKLKPKKKRLQPNLSV